MSASRSHVECDQELLRLRIVDGEVAISLSGSKGLFTEACRHPFIDERHFHYTERIDEILQWHLELTVILLITSRTSVLFRRPRVADNDISILLIDSEKGVSMICHKTISISVGACGHAVFFVGVLFNRIVDILLLFKVVAYDVMLDWHTSHLAECLNSPTTIQSIVVSSQLGISFLKNWQPPGSCIRFLGKGSSTPIVCWNFIINSNVQRLTQHVELQDVKSIVLLALATEQFLNA